MWSAQRGKRKEGTFLRSLFDANNMGWGIWLAGDICGDDYGFLLLVVLGETDFRAASGQLASGEITCNPNLPEKIVAAHGVEDELGVCRARGAFARVRQSNLSFSPIRIGDDQDGAVVLEKIIARRVGAVADGEIERNTRAYHRLLSVGSVGHKQYDQSCEDRP